MQYVESLPEGVKTGFTFDRGTMDQLDRLKGELNVRSRADVILYALALLKIAVKAADGGPITIETKDGPMRVGLRNEQTTPSPANASRT